VNLVPTIETKVGVVEQLHLIFTPALDGGEWSALISSPFTHVQNLGYPPDKRIYKPQSQPTNFRENNLLLQPSIE